jgi:hypothetical protein
LKRKRFLSLDLHQAVGDCLWIERPQLQIKRVSPRENAANSAKTLAYNSGPVQTWAVKVDT